MAHNEETAQGGARTVVLDVVVAVLIFLLGALVAYDSYQLGASWGSDGPQAGYFPFRIGAMICICATVVLVQGVLRLKTDRAVFATYPQLKQVMVILVPSTLYVGGIQLIGIYVPSALFILLFMKFGGKYSWLRSVAVGVSVSVLTFMMFEIWFKIPLPKGPVENLLGY
jgi:putative tricarboxylic transport membrane protein